jgi:hypothetical protein
MMKVVVMIMMGKLMGKKMMKTLNQRQCHLQLARLMCLIVSAVHFMKSNVIATGTERNGEIEICFLKSKRCCILLKLVAV